MSEEGAGAGSETEIQLTYNHISIIVNAINLAQKRGAYSIGDSSLLLEPMTILSKILAKFQTDNKEKTNPEEEQENKVISN
jgi:hypothetical protein